MFLQLFVEDFYLKMVTLQKSTRRVAHPSMTRQSVSTTSATSPIQANGLPIPPILVSTSANPQHQFFKYQMYPTTLVGFNIIHTSLCVEIIQEHLSSLRYRMDLSITLGVLRILLLMRRKRLHLLMDL